MCNDDSTNYHRGFWRHTAAINIIITHIIPKSVQLICDLRGCDCMVLYMVNFIFSLSLNSHFLMWIGWAHPKKRPCTSKKGKS